MTHIAKAGSLRSPDRPARARGPAPVRNSARNWDPYLLPNGVLRNLLGVEDGHELERRESLLTQIRIAEIAVRPPDGRFDLAHLRAFHRAIFGDVYDWAGELRVIDMAKDDMVFLPAATLPARFAEIERAVAALMTGPRPDWASDAALVYADICRWNGFREGNSRSGRAFMRTLAAANGYDLRFDRIGRIEMRGATMFCHAGMPQQMQSVFARACAPVPPDAAKPGRLLAASA